MERWGGEKKVMGSGGRNGQIDGESKRRRERERKKIKERRGVEIG